MPIKYFLDEELKKLAEKIVKILGLKHINLSRVAFVRSYGSKTRRVIARCHALGKVMQLGIGCDAFYVIEVISEKFDKQDGEEKIKTIIHELLHIPKTFGGGFRHHDYVSEKTINRLYKDYMQMKDAFNY